MRKAKKNISKWHKIINQLIVKYLLSHFCRLDTLQRYRESSHCGPFEAEHPRERKPLFNPLKLRRAPPFYIGVLWRAANSNSPMAWIRNHVLSSRVFHTRTVLLIATVTSDVTQRLYHNVIHKLTALCDNLDLTIVTDQTSREKPGREWSLLKYILCE